MSIKKTNTKRIWIIPAPKVPPANFISGQPSSAAKRPPLLRVMPFTKKLNSCSMKLSPSGRPKNSWEMPHSKTSRNKSCHTLLPADRVSRPRVIITAR